MCGVRIAKYNLSGNGMKKKKIFTGVFWSSIFSSMLSNQMEWVPTPLDQALIFVPPLFKCQAGAIHAIKEKPGEKKSGKNCSEIQGHL